MKKIYFILFLIFISLIVNAQDTIHIPTDYATIQAGINAANNGDLVLVEDGTYIENISYLGKAITVASNFMIDGDTNHVNNTIIDGSQPINPDNGSVVSFISGEDTNSVLCGFTITGGTGTVLIPGLIRGGGGINCNGGKICHNKIKNNTVSNYFSPIGGGILSGTPGNDKYVIIDSNIIQSNFVLNSSASGNGGGITFATDGRIYHNIIMGNIVSSQLGESFGGGLVVSFINNDSVLIVNNIIINNKAITSSASHDGLGGGLVFFQDSINTSLNAIGNVIAFNEIQSHFRAFGAGVAFGAVNGEVIFANNLIYNNYYSGPDVCSGGGLYTRDCNAKIINNTITGNKASFGGGYFSRESDNAFLMNNIFWGDTATLSDTEIKIDIGVNTTLIYNDIQDTIWPGIGNIDEAPLFVVGDTLFHLSDLSPCIGAGKDSIKISGIWYYAPPFDFDGDPRPNPSICMPDIGAQESPKCDTTTNINEIESEIPKEYSLSQNYPNPFNPSTKISWQSPVGSWQTLKVYDVLGNEVAKLVDEYKSAGNYEVEFNAAYLSSGIYFYQLKAVDPSTGSGQGFIETKKMLLLK